MVGSGIFSVFLNRTSYKPGDTLQMAAGVFAAATFVCSLSASPTAPTGLSSLASLVQTNTSSAFFKNGPNPASFLFSFFSHGKYSTNLTIRDNSIEDVLGTRTRGSRMVGADESSELWWHPWLLPFLLWEIVFCLSKISVARQWLWLGWQKYYLQLSF